MKINQRKIPIKGRVINQTNNKNQLHGYWEQIYGLKVIILMERQSVYGNFIN